MGVGYSYFYYSDYLDYFYRWDPVVVPPSEPDPTDEETLRVTEVDFLVEQNVQEHHTDEYDITDKEDVELNPDGPKLVVRRGQSFRIKIHFSRPYKRSDDDLRLVFQIGEKPSRGRGTHVEFVLSDKDHPGQWGGSLVVQDDKFIEVKVFTPPECPVGKWDFKVHVVRKKDDEVSLFSYTHKDPIYVLFNPWCKEDTVYMGEAVKRDEYVLNEKGSIWTGNHYSNTAKPWIFGQFSGNVLDCCMYLMDRVKLNVKDRGNVIVVVRQLSAAVNSNDVDSGVVSGNWSGDYSGGTSPLTWIGSKAILEQFYKNKKPVQYGQCWVYSGVLTTVCRALGIPARSVTNFESAHDVDASITIEYIFNDDMEKETYNGDSVWNFHVWNEAWMTRPELPPGYSGWQACDATPQEMSDGSFRCGPCPVLSIKEGKVNLPYDGPFIFAEVNADMVYWVKLGEMYKLISVRRSGVGKKMSTRSLSGDREDVTGNYKYEEGSAKERDAIRNAMRHTNSHRATAENPSEVAELQLLFAADKTFVGEDFSVTVQGRSTVYWPFTLRGKVVVKVMLYTGDEGDIVSEQPFEMTLGPQQSDEVEVKVREEDYLGKLKDMCLLSLGVMATLEETGQVFLKFEELRLRKPHLEITGPTSAQRWEEFEVQVAFTNPLSTKLTHCYLEWESDGIRNGKKKDLGNVGPKETFTHTLRLKPTKRGRRELVVSFNCKELEDVNGTFDIHVTR